MRKKRKLLRKHARKKKIHCILLINRELNNPNRNFTYLTGYGGYGTLLLLKDKEILFVPKMEYERAKKEVKGIKVVKVREKSSKDIRKYLSGKNIGIDYTTTTLDFMKYLRKTFRKKKFVDISALLLEARSTKKDFEIRNLRKACRISDSILRKCFRKFSSFRTEKQVADFLKEESLKNNCELSFSPIVASGAGASSPHYTPENIKLRKGFCIIDFGVRYKGYCSDTTRTIYIGKPSEKETTTYNHILNAQQKTINNIKQGMKCAEIWNFCMKELGKYSKNMIHGLGHGVGLRIHELPNIAPKSKDVIKRGMVFTVEPGIYFQGKFGIRIEDTVIMGKKPILLTKTPKALLRIKKR